jgi:hypothetical protein
MIKRVLLSSVAAIGMATSVQAKPVKGSISGGSVKDCQPPIPAELNPTWPKGVWLCFDDSDSAQPPATVSVYLDGRPAICAFQEHFWTPWVDPRKAHQGNLWACIGLQ